MVSIPAMPCVSCLPEQCNTNLCAMLKMHNVSKHKTEPSLLQGYDLTTSPTDFNGKIIASAEPTNISRLAHGVKWICLPMNSSRNSESNLPPKYVSCKRRTQNYRKRRPTIIFIPPRVNAFSASGIIAGFIPTTEASIGISRSSTIRLIHFLPKSVRHISTMRFRYGMYMCIGGRITNNIGEKYRPIEMKY